MCVSILKLWVVLILYVLSESMGPKERHKITRVNNSMKRTKPTSCYTFVYMYAKLLEEILIESSINNNINHR